MSVIGTGTIISKDNLDKYLFSLAHSLEGREIRNTKNLFLFNNNKRVSEGDVGELIAIDLDKNSEFPFVFYFDKEIRYYKFIIVMGNIKYFDKLYRIDNIFYLNDECFVYDESKENLMYEIIKKKPQNNIPITDLGLTVRTTNCLLNYGINTIKQLIQLTEKDLINIRNFGITSLSDVKYKLEEHGLSLREE